MHSESAMFRGQLLFSDESYVYHMSMKGKPVKEKCVAHSLRLVCSYYSLGTRYDLDTIQIVVLPVLTVFILCPHKQINVKHDAHVNSSFFPNRLRWCYQFHQNLSWSSQYAFLFKQIALPFLTRDSVSFLL